MKRYAVRQIVQLVVVIVGISMLAFSILHVIGAVIIVIATLQVARVIILESFLSFLGLGVQPPTPAWGNVLGEGRVYMLNSWWIAAFPGLAIFVTTLAINLMGNALRDWLDPHMKL
jgi:ABC-type dipeptide/oligopeptide/nickel transport system permease subunit